MYSNFNRKQCHYAALSPSIYTAACCYSCLFLDDVLLGILSDWYGLTSSNQMPQRVLLQLFSKTLSGRALFLFFLLAGHLITARQPKGTPTPANLWALRKATQDAAEVGKRARKRVAIHSEKKGSGNVRVTRFMERAVTHTLEAKQKWRHVAKQSILDMLSWCDRISGNHGISRYGGWPNMSWVMLWTRMVSRSINHSI